MMHKGDTATMIYRPDEFDPEIALLAILRYKPVKEIGIGVGVSSSKRSSMHCWIYGPLPPPPTGTPRKSAPFPTPGKILNPSTLQLLCGPTVYMCGQPVEYENFLVIISE